MDQIPWQGPGEVYGLWSDMDRLFARQMQMARHSGGGGGLHVEMEDKGQELVLRAQVGAFDPQSIRVRISDDRVVLRGERRAEVREERDGYLHRASSYGTASRTVSLPVRVDADRATTTMKDGVLELRMPKRS